MYPNKGIQAYKRESLRSDLASADPYRIIQLLMQGALERLAQGKGCIERRDFEGKSDALTKACAIINALRDALDESVNPELCANLEDLYVYMVGRVTEASRQLDTGMLDEVSDLLLTIKSAWDQISDADKQHAEQIRSES